jgi:hypothetical protein
MDADISRLQSEFAHLHPAVVKALYQHLATTRGGRPRRKRARAYIRRVTTSLDPATLWERLGLTPASRPTPRRRPPSEDGARTTRRRGRPGWTAELFWARYREACERAGGPYVYRTIAPHFLMLHGERGTDAEYIRKLVRRFGLPPG